jgi:hypothetical protein
MLLTFEGLAGVDGDTVLETLNFGAGGFYGDVDRRLQPLTRLALRIVFPAFGAEPTPPRTIECEALVVRVDPPAAGKQGCRIAAHFRYLAPEQRNHLNAYVLWHNEVFAGSGEEVGGEIPADEDAA